MVQFLLRENSLSYYFNNIRNLQKQLTAEIISEATFLLLTYLLWNIYFQFAMEYIIEGTYTPPSPRNCSWITIGKLWNRSSTVRFLYAMDRAGKVKFKYSIICLIPVLI